MILEEAEALDSVANFLAVSSHCETKDAFVESLKMEASEFIKKRDSKVIMPAYPQPNLKWVFNENIAM